MSLPGISGFGKHFPANTNTVLTRSPTGSSILVGQPITFTATVTGPGSTPTGSVTFIDNGVGFASSSLNASGVATTTTSSLAVGGHTITAQYNGDVVFGTSVSVGVAVTIFTTTRKVLFLTSGGSWQVPSDWSNTNNSIECIGGGGGAGAGGGGGGGGYAKAANVQLSPGSVIGLTIGGGGGGGASGNNGGAGGTTSLAGVTAGGGGPGTAGFFGNGTGGGGGGGTFAGGNGGGTPSNVVIGGGGGGAGGPNGGGGGGASGGSGGAGDAGAGGGGGGGGAFSTGGNGGNGNEYGSGVGAGGGGGGAQNNGGSGGSYGGGGGGGASVGGSGIQGIVIVTYVS